MGKAVCFNNDNLEHLLIKDKEYDTEHCSDCRICHYDNTAFYNEGNRKWCVVPMRFRIIEKV